MRELVDGTRLVHLQSYKFQHPHSALLSAYVERWQPDTNSFHMPFGEITVTLHDVELILRIPTQGGIVDSQYSREQLVWIV